MVASIDWPWLIECLRDVSERAQRFVASPAVNKELPVSLKQESPPIARDTPGLLLDAARQLVDLKSEVLLGGAAKNHLMPSAALASEQLTEVHADLLAATWLGLYFLGLPFNAPWERALRLVEGGGGLPHGAMINKALGDVYRWARRALPRDFGKEALDKLAPPPTNPPTLAPSFHPLGVFVLTRRPFALVPMAEWPRARCITQPCFAALGRSYALLQLRLYVAEGLPIAYVIPIDLLRDLLASPGAAAKAAAWMCSIVGPQSVAHQHVLVSDNPKKTVGLPTCVLAHNRGVYTLEGNDESMPGAASVRRPDDEASLPDHGLAFAGNRVGSALAKAYRERLSRAEGKPLTWNSGSHLERQLGELASRAPQTAM